MNTIVAMNVDTAGTQVRTRDTELQPADHPPPAGEWSAPISLAATLQYVGADQGLALALLAGSLNTGLGPLVIQRHVVIDGVADRIVEYELTARETNA